MPQQEFIADISQMYVIDNERRARLAEMTESVSETLRELELNLDANDAEQLRERITSETFKILIIGEFNTGKSTFINALLGAEVLPSKAIPATAIINQVRYGDKPAAKLHFRDPEKEAVKVPVEKLNEYVLIKSAEENAARNEIRESPFSHAEILWPLELCRENNVEIIDSPGLNESKVRESVTYDYVRKVDAVLFVMAAVRFGPAQTEMDTILMLEAAGHQDLFFVINQWDLLRLGKDKEEVRGRAMNLLPNLTKRGNDIYFVSALDALEGRINKDRGLEERSGFQPLESSLHRFLAEERGRIKALRGAREMLLIIKKLQNESIPTKINLLSTPLEELKTKYENAKKELDKLHAEKDNMLNFVTRERTQITNLVRSRVKEFFFVTDNRVGEWCREFDISLSINPNVKSQVNDATNRLVEHLTNNLSASFKEWEKESLTPFIQDRIQSLLRELETRASDFENRLSDVQFALSGSAFRQIDVSNEFGPKNALERILSAAGGFVIGGVGGGAIGAIFGYKELLKTILPSLAAIVTGMIIGIPVLPVAIIVNVIVGGIIISSISKNIVTRLKSEVGERFRQSLRENSATQAEQITDQLDQKLEELKDALEAGMERQIAEISEQTEAALDDHQKGEGEVTQKLTRIESIKSEIKEIEEELNSFIRELGDTNEN